MTDNKAGTIVNEHYLNKVLDLSEQMGVAATEDIYDAHGNKLLAKGASVSRRLQEKLIVHRLRKPIESCLAVEGGVDGKRLAACLVQAVEESPALAALLAASNMPVAAVERELASIHFGAAMTMMLTMIDRASRTSLRHVVEVAALSMAFASRVGLSPADQRVACMAGVLHDIGELYIEPGLINAARTLTPEEWSHVIIHPHIGRLLIHDLESCPEAVAVAVAEHHERLNGTGYPRALTGAQISLPGQMVASAELISGLLHKPNALQRAELALKIVSGEHPRAVAAIVSQAGRMLEPQPFEIASAAINDDDIARLSARLDEACALAAALATSKSLSPKHQDLMTRTRNRIVVKQRAFVSTGLDMHLAVTQAAQGAYVDHLEIFESEIALREISWRLRDIGRDLAIQLGAAKQAIDAKRLVDLLCGEDDGKAARAAPRAANETQAAQAPGRGAAMAYA